MLFGLKLTQAGASTLARRARQGPRREGWAWHFETLVDMMHRNAASERDFTVADLRAGFDRIVKLIPPPPVSLEETTVAGVAAAWIARDEIDVDRVLLYLHGGAYVSGSARHYHRLLAELTNVCNMPALAIDYRLAPEHPFPAALEDAWSAYWWLLAEGVRPERIAIGGDSAGGGLTMALLLALKETGMPQPAAAFAISPWLDLTMSGISIETNYESDYLSLPGMERTAALYLDGCNPRNPLASPIFGDLRGLPPLLVQAGTAEMLYDDARVFCKHAADAGVDVEFEPWPNMVHVWHAFQRLDTRAQEAIASIGRFVREQTAPPVNGPTYANNANRSPKAIIDIERERK